MGGVILGSIKVLGSLFDSRDEGRFRATWRGQACHNLHVNE